MRVFRGRLDSGIEIFSANRNRQTTGCIAIFGIDSGPWIGRTMKRSVSKKNDSH